MSPSGRRWALALLAAAASARAAPVLSGPGSPVPPSYFQAAKAGDAAALSAALDAGIPVDAPSEDGYTALMYAAYHGRAGAVRLLRARGADPCLGDKRGNTALMGAIFKGHEEAALALLDACEPDRRNHAGQTPLMYAALFGREELARRLLARGARPELRDREGRDAESLARGQWNQAMVKLLKLARVIRR